ncbi:MAG: PucC family protein, partial [Pseudomonadota bacterium]
LFVCGVALIGMGSGVFSVCVLTSVMTVIEGQNSGIALGAWGAVQATSIGVGVAVGGAIRDGVIRFSDNGLLGEAFATPSAGYTAVYHIEIILLFVGLAIIGPLAKFSGGHSRQSRGARFSLPVFPQ